MWGEAAYWREDMVSINSILLLGSLSSEKINIIKREKQNTTQYVL